MHRFRTSGHFMFCRTHTARAEGHFIEFKSNVDPRKDEFELLSEAWWAFYRDGITVSPYELVVDGTYRHES